MGTFRCGLILAAVLATAAFAQDAVPGQPQPQPQPVDPLVIPPAAPENEAALPAQIPPADGIATNAPAGEHKKAPAKPKKKAAPKMPTLRGTATSINTTNMTLTVDVKGKEEVVKITSNSRIFADAKPAILADGKQGEKVIVEYRNAKDKSKEALAIRFGSLTPSAASTPAAAPDKKAKE